MAMIQLCSLVKTCNRNGGKATSHECSILSVAMDLDTWLSAVRGGITCLKNEGTKVEEIVTQVRREGWRQCRAESSISSSCKCGADVDLGHRHGLTAKCLAQELHMCNFVLCNLLSNGLQPQTCVSQPACKVLGFQARYILPVTAL